MMTTKSIFFSLFLLTSTEAWSSSHPRRVINHYDKPSTSFQLSSSSPLFNTHKLTTSGAVCRMSATQTAAVHSKSTRLLQFISNRRRNVLQLMHTLLSKLTQRNTKVTTVMTSMLLFVIAATLLPQSAMAKVASSVVETTTSGGGRKVGKLVITLGAVGAGAASAHLLRGKFDDNTEESEDGVMNGEKKSVENEVSVQSPPPVMKSTDNDDEAKTTKPTEIEPLSQEWIEQQLNDAEKRSAVLKDAAKMTQTNVVTPTPTPSKPKNTPSSPSTNNKQKLSVGPTIGIPLVKNLDSKIEHLQKRTSERTLEQQRINNELAQVEQQKKEVANVVAMEKIEAAEREYRARVNGNVGVVEEKSVNGDSKVKSTVTTTDVVTKVVEEVEEEKGLKIKFGYGGIPAKSKEEDLELTTQVILDHVKTVDGKSGGVVDDEE